MTNIWGIDLGGTKIEGIVTRQDAILETKCRIRINTEADRGYEHILSQIKKLTDLMMKECKEPPRLIGISSMGSLNPETNLMKNCNTTCLNGKPLKTDLEKLLKTQIVLANDANCFALAEARVGAGQGARSCFGVIMGTGVGGGVILDNKIIRGKHDIAGEWGHNVLIPDGNQCYCGKKGCVETVISGPALERYYFEQSRTKLSLKTINERYLEGKDIAAVKTIERLAEYFGKAISTVINIIDPDCVILGGGLSNLEILYHQGFEEVRKNVFSDNYSGKVLKNELGDSAGVFGAAMLVIEES